MTQRRIRRKSASADALKARNGAPASPIRTAAIPIVIAMTMICRTLNDSAVRAVSSVSLVDASSPRIFAGTSPRRKSSHDPAVVGATALAALTPAVTPGWIRRAC
jgi:hypothetical protein